MKTRTDEAGQFDLRLRRARERRQRNRDPQEPDARRPRLPGADRARRGATGTTTNYTWDNFGRLIDVTIPGITTTTPAITPGRDHPLRLRRRRRRDERPGKIDGGPPTRRSIRQARRLQRVRRAGPDHCTATTRSAHTDALADTRRLTTADTTIQVAGQPTRTQAFVYTYDQLGNVTTRYAGASGGPQTSCRRGHQQSDFHLRPPQPAGPRGSH